MNIRSLIAVLSVATLTGCWPYLGDPYESYLDGDSDSDNPDPDTRVPDPDTEDPDTDPDTVPLGDGPGIAGWAEQIEVLGSYLVGFGDVTLVVVAGGIGSDELYAYEDSFPSRGTCRSLASFDLIGDLDDAAMNVGLPSVINPTLEEGELELIAVEGAPNLRGRQFTFEGAGFYNKPINLTTSVSAGGLQGVLTRTASDFTVTAPAGMSGSSPPTIPFAPFVVGWSGTLSDQVVVEVVFAEDEATVGLDGVHCNVSGGSITIDPLDYNAETADFAVVSVSRIRRFSGSFSGTANANAQMSGVLTKIGRVNFE